MIFTEPINILRQIVTEPENSDYLICSTFVFRGVGNLPLCPSSAQQPLHSLSSIFHTRCFSKQMLKCEGRQQKLFGVKRID